MVFESIVVDVLNRLLGDYFENLDTSQLQLGIWGGDVVLRNLMLRRSALDDVGPFKVAVGRLGSLTMKIPWTSLYTAPVIVNVSDLYLLVMPSHSVKYNEEAEEKAALFAKQKEIQRIEEARQRELAKKQGPQKPEDDTFTEKLIAQIIKNVQIKIESIHVRYEDVTSNPSRPFSFGAVLQSLRLETTNADWKPQIITEMVQIIHKLAELKGLSIYWNSSSEIFHSNSASNELMLQKMKDYIDNPEIKYVLGPIMSEAKVKLAPNPDRVDVPFSVPKVLVNVVMQELALGLTNAQFQDVMHLVEALDYMSRSQHYRKYRPASDEHRGHGREWWKFAYRCIVEEEVRRRRQNWDWNHMQQHRNLCKAYANALYEKKTAKKVKPETEATIAHCEKVLDVFNITLVRKQVEVKLARRGVETAPTEQKGGWFSWSGWFGGAEPSETTAQGALTTTAIAQKFEEALTPEEKQKLYSAIDYKENDTPLEYPDEFEEYILNFLLVRLKLIIRDDYDATRQGHVILDVVARDLNASLRTRPVKSGMKFDLDLDDFYTTGIPKHGREPPYIMKMNNLAGVTDKLLRVNFETNPLNSDVDTRIIVKAQPLEVIYHAKTINELVKCFSLPREMQLSRLQAAAVTTLEEWKLQSASGLQYMLDRRGEVEIDAELTAPFLIIPQDGQVEKPGSVLVVNLGAIRVKSEPRVKVTAGKVSFEEMKRQSYDKFYITLRDFQVILALPGEDYRSCLGRRRAIGDEVDGVDDKPVYLINSREFVVRIEQSLVQDDPRFERLKISAKLPLLDVAITENRLLELITLLVTLPYPQSEPVLDMDIKTKVEDNPRINEYAAVSKLTYGADLLDGKDTKKRGTEVVEFTEMVVSFGVNCFKVAITRSRNEKLVPLAAFELNRFKAKLISKTFGTGIQAAIGGLSVQAFEHSHPGLEGPLYILKTPMTEGEETHLLHVDMFSITPDCPVHLASNIKQHIKADISKLDIILHLEALKQIIEFSEDCSDSITNSMMKETIDLDSISVSSVSIRRPEIQRTQVSKIEATRRAVAKKHTDPKDILLQLDAHLDQLSVQFSSDTINLAKIVLSKIDASYKQHVKQSLMSLEMTDLNVLNLAPDSVYKQLVKVDADKVVYVNVLMVDDATTGQNYLDMSKFDMKITIETGSPRIIYLAPVVADILTFLDAFQTAKDAVIEASSAAADMARENIGQAYSSASRMLLDITLRAPKIVIPRNEKTADAFLADLGNLTLKNKFKKEQVSRVSQYAITDEMHINFYDIKLSRILVDSKTGTIKAEVSVLDPIFMSMDITRNLSAEWYHKIPAMKIEGVLDTSSIRLSNEDYTVLMAMLTENLAAPGKLEKFSPPPKAKASLHAKSQKLKVNRQSSYNSRRTSNTPSKMNVGKFKKASTAVLAAGTVSSTKTLVPVSEEPEPPRVDMAMTMRFQKMGLVLYSGSSNLEKAVGLIQRHPSSAFANFALQTIDCVVDMWNNGGMKVDLTLEDVSLEDCRPGARAITNLITRKQDVDSLLGNFIVRVSYKTDGSDETGPSLVIETTSLAIVLCLDYLLQLSSFFTSAQPSVEPSKEQSHSVVQQPAAVEDSAKSREALRKKMEEEGYEKKLVNSKMYFNMAETDIVLVEDMDTLHANALLLNCEVSLKSISNDERSNMMGTISNIKLSTCNYDPERRYQRMAEVISPMSITMVMNSSQEAGTLIDLNISNIFIRLTAGTLELLLKISSGISASPAEEKPAESVNLSEHWSRKKIEDLDFWFLKPDVTVEVGTDVATHDQTPETRPLFEVASELTVRERLILESGAIVITFEAGGGQNTLPLLLIESDIDLQVFDWSHKLQVAGRMKLEAAYYNTKYGLWEFLIEPVETRHHGKVSHQPWEMLFEYTTSPESSLDNVVPDVASNYMGITLQSNDILEMTVSKAALDIINVLTEEFNAAAKSLVSERDVITAPYIICNDLGTPIRLDLRNSPFVCYRKGVSYEEAILNNGTSVNLGLVESFDMTKHYTSVLREQEGREERLLKLHIPKFDFTTEIPVNRAEKRFYPLHAKTEFGDTYGILCDIAVKDCSKLLTIRGIVQVVNELPVPVDVFVMDSSENVLKLVGTLELQATYNVPLEALYTKTGELFFAPRGYKVASLPCAWPTLMREVKSVNYLVSDPLDLGQNFYMKVVGEVKQTLFESTNRKTLASKCCYIYLRPPLVIHNLLPVPLGYFGDDNADVRVANEGSTVTVTDIFVNESQEFVLNLKIDNYHGYTWTARVHMLKTTGELSSLDFESTDKKHTVTLGIHKELVDETNLILHIYCPYWMVNRTGMDLYYKGDVKEAHPTVIHHKSESEHPIMFSFKGKAFFSKKRALVKFKGSDWSEKFSLDVAGSSGTVVCKSPHQEYQIGLEIVLLSWGLTKAIIFTPRFYLINQSPFTLCVQETQKEKKDHNENIIELPEKSCVSFWPNLANPYLLAFIHGTEEKTKLFRYDHVHDTLLRLDNKFGGIHVDVHVTERSTVITFTEYAVGHAPALLVNATPDCSIEFWEKGVDDVKILLPGWCQFIAWDDPMGERTLEWGPVSAGKRATNLDKLHSDGTGRFQWVDDRNTEKSYCWISFLDGLQRVLLFTEDEELARYLQAARETDQVQAEYIIMFHGLGLSLVDGDKGQEILYTRIASSDIMWQACKPGKSKRFKPLSSAENQAIEAAYQHYLNEKTISSSAKSHITLDSGVEVDFATSSIVKPNPRELRRVFQTGIWLHYKQYPHANHVHAKLYRLQIDNQLPDSVFPVVLAPVAPPKSVSTQKEPLKPFAEVSIMQRITAHSSVTQYKYFKVLIQEFLIRADIGFINAVVGVFSQTSNQQLDQVEEYYKKDLGEYSTPVYEILARQITTQGQKHFYDFLHFSPLKIHLSFSMGGSAQLSNNFLNLLLQSVGVTLTEIQDVVFKLACLEIQHAILSGDQLYNELYNHYKSQAIKQLYVLVLGLDVIGNPYGLVVGVTQGVEAFFYEPLHGAIQGPTEFAEGLALGCKALLGHTVGGAAGALSKITGTLGKGIAALTLDEEFKQKRREMMNKRPHDVAEAFARSGKGLVMGFYDGVTGVVTKPIKGAQEDGVEGFFKGLGKGAVGLFVRPVTGIVDFTSGSLDAVKRATAITDDIRRLRPPRHIPIDSVIQPYVAHEAEGMQLLQDLEKGKYASTDVYVAHALINPHGLHVLLLTNKRLFFLKRDDIFGGWTIQWAHLWEDFAGLPVIVEKGLVFKLKPADRKLKFLGKSSEKELVVHLHNPEVCTSDSYNYILQWILGKIETAMKFEAGISNAAGVSESEALLSEDKD